MIPSPSFAAAVRRNWHTSVDVARPNAGRPTFDDITGTYTDPFTAVGSAVSCHIRWSQVDRRVDVAADPAQVAQARIDHHPSVSLRVDDVVTVTVHPDAALVGAEFRVTSVGHVEFGLYGTALMQRTETDRRG